MRGQIAILLIAVSLFGCKGSGTLSPGEVKSFRGTDQFVHEGIQVFHRKTGSDVISVKVFIRGGTTNYVDKFEGIEYLSLRIAVEGGTILYTPEEYRDKARSVGASISVGRPGLDFSVVSMKCVTENFSAGWDMMTQPLMNPTFKADYFELFRKEQTAAIERQSSGPMYLLVQARKNLFGERNYSKVPIGNSDAMEYVSAAETMDFFQSLVTKGRVFIVVHGFVEQERIKEKIDQTIAALPGGYFSSTDQFLKSLSKSEIHKTDEESPISGISASFPGPNGGTKESIAMRMAMMILQDRLTGGEGGNILALFNESRQCFSTIAAFGSDADRDMDAVIYELRQIFNNGIAKEELTAQKKRMITERSMLLEEMEGHAHLMGLSEVYGEWTGFGKFNDYFEHIDKKTVDREFRKWCRGISWTFQGNTEEIQLEKYELPIHEKK